MANIQQLPSIEDVQWAIIVLGDERYVLGSMTLQEYYSMIWS